MSEESKKKKKRERKEESERERKRRHPLGKRELKHHKKENLKEKERDRRRRAMFLSFTREVLFFFKNIRQHIPRQSCNQRGHHQPTLLINSLYLVCCYRG